MYVTKKFELEIKVFCSESSELATDCGFGVSVCILLLSAVNSRLYPPTSQGSRDRPGTSQEGLSGMSAHSLCIEEFGLHTSDKFKSYSTLLSS